MKVAFGVLVAGLAIAGATASPGLAGQSPLRVAPQLADHESVEEKKQNFFNMLTPLIEQSNDEILKDRKRLLKDSQEHSNGGSLSSSEQDWLDQLAKKYNVTPEDDGSLTARQLKILTRRVDIVPLSLALAQGADESAWGTSRFAKEGNAFFGQWSYGGKGIAPKGHQAGKGDYKVASFDTPLQSVEAYMHNLNTGTAYAAFREKRAKLRAAGQPLGGAVLAHSMTHYSQRGEAYVKDLEAIIRVNHLTDRDKN